MAALAYLFGGGGALLGILLAFVVTDYITGVVAAALEGKLASGIGYKGIAKKVMIFIIVAMAHLADQAIGPGFGLDECCSIFLSRKRAIIDIRKCGEDWAPGA